jgi:chromosome segregation ATPase
MISGRQALATIEQAVARARDEESRAGRALQATADEVARLRMERMEAFRELARLKLDPEAGKDVLGDIDAAERRALNLLAERRDTLARLTDRRQAAEAAERDAEQERHQKAAALEEALKAMEELRTRVEADTRVSGDWAAQRARVAEAAAVAMKAEEKAVKAEADREEKRKPYEADPLFMYLWRRKFGTPDDRAGFLTRFLDRKVARLVGYDRARANYVLLNDIPVRLREHANDVKAEADAQRRHLAEVERAALLRAGIEPLQARASEAARALREAEGKLADAKARLAEFDRTYDTSFLQGDAPYREAVELLAQADAQQDIRRLYDDAAKTPSPKDEAIIRRIDGTATALVEAAKKLIELREQARQLAQRRSAIEAERDEFRRRRYDDPYAKFGNEAVLSSVLGGILAGMLQGTVLRDVLQGGYHRQPGPWDSDFGRSSFPPPSPQDGGWGGGDDGFSTGGTMGGGDGFRTGGSF